MNSAPGNSRGLQEILNVCNGQYPSNRDPLLVMSRTKYWLGGPDPLDYIAMFWNNGKIDGVQVSPPHWHYITMGLSDLHGDGRVHPLPSAGSSGLGIELTFRLRCGGMEEENPPTWPAVFLQKMAKIWLSRNVRYGSKPPPSPGHTQSDAPFGIKTPTDDKPHMRSLIYCSDTQLAGFVGVYGRVDFLQLVGVFEDEVMAAEEWDPLEFVLIIANETHNQLLVTDFSRPKSILSMPGVWNAVEVGKSAYGSKLIGRAGHCRWAEWLDSADCASATAQSKETILDAPKNLAAISIEMCETLIFYVKIMVEGRLPHGRRFTFCDSSTSDMITWVPEADMETGLSANKLFYVVPKPNYRDVFIYAVSPVLELLRQIVQSNSIGVYAQSSIGLRISVIPRS